MPVSVERLGRLQAGVVAAKAAYKDAITARDEEIVKADGEGRTLGWLARATTLKTSHLQRIIIKQVTGRQ